jgi:hypothetical protein
VAQAAVALVVVAGMTGCASGDDAATPEPSVASSASGSESTSEAASPTEKVVEISVSVADGKVTPKPRRVEVDQDSQVRLLVTSDVDDELHIHGYDIEAELEAGRPTTVEFAATQQGLFELETHETELELLQLEVR